MATKITEYLTREQVAQLFRVHRDTVTRWDNEGRFPAGTVIRTLGGHRRFKQSAIQAMLNGHDGEAQR